MATAIDQLRKISTMGFQLSRRDVAQRIDRREVLPEKTHAFFALRAAIVVFTAGVAVFDHGVADDHGNPGGKRQELIFEGTAIEKDGVMRAAEAGGELVHDADASADKFI